MFADASLLLFELADREAERIVVRRRLLLTVERAGLTTREIRSGT